MTDVLSLHTLAPTDLVRFDRLFALYASAIPTHEQKSRAALRGMLATPGYVFTVAESESDLAGFAISYTCRGAPIVLLEYLAVAPTLRSAGLGGRLFQRVAREAGEAALLVEMDTPERADASTLQRQRFYERQGCRRIEQLMYLLPLPDRVAPPMWLLVWPAHHAPSRDALTDWLRALYTEVYGCRADDPRITRMLHDPSASEQT